MPGFGNLRAAAAAVSVAAIAVLIVAAAAAMAGPAAYAEAPVRVRGEVVKLDGNVLQVKDRQGRAVAVTLAANYAVSELRRADFADIKPGSYIGTAALPQADGTLKAMEVLIFPPALKGAGEGHRPWDLAPQSTMTNASVDGVVAAGAGRTLKLVYKGGEKTLVVPPEAPIVALGPGNPAMLKPGAHIFIAAATKGTDGTLTANRVTVGKDGLVPPM
ncbi:MAG: hypothetical protein KIT16_09255 [Rhodospirillaceae bacterium]|nr:hypothetical protein [Rhodospirillaceae bacterium]